MKRIALLLGFVAFAACRDVPTSTPTNFRPSLAAAEQTINLSVPTTLLVFVSCANGGAGELVLLSGDLHILIHETINSAGGLSFKEHFQPQGISGAGLTTGDKYQATGVTQDHVSIAANGLPFEETFVNNFRIIGQGPGNNFTVHENFHITVNANGDITAFQDNISADCK